MVRLTKAKKTLAAKIAKMNAARVKPRSRDPVTRVRRRRRRMRRIINRTCSSSYLLVLDIDGTIVNYRDRATIARMKKTIKKLRKTPSPRALVARPNLWEFLVSSSRGFDIILFTAGNEGHLRYVMKKFGMGLINAGFSNRWMHRGHKDVVAFMHMKKTVVFVDDDSRHYKAQSAKHLIKVPTWVRTNPADRGLREALYELEHRYPNRFVYKCKTPQGSDDSVLSTDTVD